MAATVGLLAGEASGDRLGAGLMRALRAARPELQFAGVGGEAMLAEGLAPLASMDGLAINGFKDPILKLPRLLRLLAGLRRQFLAEPPAVFVGVDFNQFNLRLERLLKRRGVPTVHYVSPSVYAWRPGRAQRIGQCADRLLALYPFEPALYQSVGLDVAFVGHPLADAIGFDAGDQAHRHQARQALGLPADAPVVALLPGSRMSELGLLLEPFLDAAALIRQALPDAFFVIPCPRPALALAVAAALAERPGLPAKTHRGDARLALTASNAAIVKCGTGTLEAMLLRRPMVASYRLGPLAYRLARRLVHSQFVALPNILAGRALVPELLQDEATPAALAENLLAELDKSVRRADYLPAFGDLHASLRRNADQRAAQAVAELLKP